MPLGDDDVIAYDPLRMRVS